MMRRQQDSGLLESQSSGISAAIPFIAVGCLACIGLAIAVIIVLALIPVYLRSNTISTNLQSLCAETCKSACTPQCLSFNVKCNSIPQTITIVTVNDDVPFISQNGANAPTGFDVDLMNNIANLLQINFTYQYETFSQLIPIVRNNRNTISISAQTDTLAREQFVNFAQFFQTGTGFLVKSSYTQTINNLSDLCGKKVAVESTSIQQNDVTNQNANCGGNSITILAVASFTEVVNAVQSGTADVGLDDQSLFLYTASQSNGQLKVVGQAYSVAPYGIVCNKQNPALCCLLVSAINYLIQQGTYQQLLTKYSFTFAANEICPSRLNLNGQTCISSCVPTTSFCQNLSG